MTERSSEATTARLAAARRCFIGSSRCLALSAGCSSARCAARPMTSISRRTRLDIKHDRNLPRSSSPMSETEQTPITNALNFCLDNSVVCDGNRSKLRRQQHFNSKSPSVPVAFVLHSGHHARLCARFILSFTTSPFLDMVGVTGSIPVAPTIAAPWGLSARLIASRQQIE